jgi:hypothetical protein
MAGWLHLGCLAGRNTEGTDKLHLEPTVLFSHHPICLAFLPRFACRGPAPLDADEIREAVEQLMLRRAPTALVRLIGKNAYAR